MDAGAGADAGGACRGGVVDVCRGGAGRSVVKPGGGDRDAGVPGAGTEATDGRCTVKPGGGGLDACVPSPGTGVTDGTGWEGARRGAGAGRGPVPLGIPTGRKETDGGRHQLENQARV